VQSNRFLGSFGVVYPQHVCSAVQGPGVGSRGSVQGEFGCGVQGFVNHRFTGYTHQQWATEGLKDLQLVQEVEVVVRGFPESKAGIEQHVVHAQAA
jgi:hypothetical protein